MGENIKHKGRALTAKQLDLLKLLFRFRFATAEHLAQAQNGVSLQSIRIRLKTMVANDLIVMKRDGSDRIMGKPATYRLSSKGMAELKKQGNKYSEKVLNAIRANRHSSENFINRHLSIFKIYNLLTSSYGNDLLFLTKSNLAADKFEYLPEVKPDALIHLTSQDKSYFLYYLDESMPDFALFRRIAPIFEYEKSGKWEAATEQDFPRVLIVSSTNRVETVMRKRLSKVASDERSDIVFAGTTLERLSEGDDSCPWRPYAEDENIRLEDL